MFKTCLIARHCNTNCMYKVVHSQVICVSETNDIQTIWTKKVSLKIGFMPVLT